MGFDSEDDLKKKLAEQFQASQAQNSMVEGLTGLPTKAANAAGSVMEKMRAPAPQQEMPQQDPTQVKMYDNISDQDLGNALFGLAQSGRMGDFQQANPDFKGLREKEMKAQDPQEKMKLRSAILQRLSKYGK